jgi:hypothetical protein
MAREKPVFLNGKEIGFARSWTDVAQILGMSLDRLMHEVLVGSVQRFEGPDGFHITAPND